MSEAAGVRIKEERPDEAEIRELAAKMVEANKAKLLAAGNAQRPPNQQPPNPQGSILNYLNRKPTGAPTGGAAPPTTPVVPLTPEAEKKPLPDEASWKGHFGWEKLGDCYIPYIFRQGEKYCAVRMVEVKLLNKYLNYLHPDIHTCTCIRSYYITEVESRLLNEINIKHCDGQFGRELFNLKDLVVRLSDANEFYNFLDVCYNKLSQEKPVTKDKCGFIRINRESVVPYTVRDAQKYVPLFYFEGETDNLKLKADQLEGWDLSYLKFCCKVQGIRNELFASETCSVISLTDIKSYFPPGTEFEEYWPNKVMDSQLLISSKGSMAANIGGQWTRAPPGPPVMHGGVPTVGSSTGSGRGRRAQNTSTAAVHQQQQMAAAQRAQHSLPAVSHAEISVAVQALANSWNGLVNGQPGFGAGLTQVQTQQVLRLAQAQVAARFGQSSVRNSSHSPATMTPAQARHHMQQQYSNNSIGLAMAQQQQAPPPLVRTSQTNNIRAHQSSVSITRTSSNHSSQNSNGHVRPPEGKPLSVIPEVPTTGSHVPYKVQKALVEHMMVPCINMKPYVYSELLMTLPDLVSFFFPNVNLNACRQVLEVLGLELYKGNRTQMNVLRNAGKYKSSMSDNNIAMVQIRDVMQYMPQLKYMLSRSSVGADVTGVSESIPAKRARAS